MASSTFVAGGGDGKDQPRPNQHPQVLSPQKSFKKAWPANNPQTPPTPPSCAQGHHHHHHHHDQAGGTLPKCVCAPTTHAGSFKCRLHRQNSHGHSTPTTPSSTGRASSPWSIEAL